MQYGLARWSGEALIWTLSDFRSDFYTPGPILTDRMGEQQRKRVLNSLAKHISHVLPELTKRISAFTRKVGRFQKRRNDLIHATWNLTEHPEKAYYSIKEATAHGPEWKDKETSVKELNELANRAFTLSDECIKLIVASQSAHILRRRALRTKP